MLKTDLVNKIQEIRENGADSRIERVKQIADIQSDVAIHCSADLYRRLAEVLDNSELPVKTRYIITELARVYSKIKRGEISRSEGARQQKELLEQLEEVPI